MLATNAWAASLRELHRRLVVISSDMIATAAVPERLAEIGWTGGECISDSQMQIHYYHATRDGRVAFGKGGWGIALAGRIPASFDRNDRARATRSSANFRRLYPTLADVPGRVRLVGADRPQRPRASRSSATWAGGEHIVYGVGWSGNGVAPSRCSAGSILASLALGADDEWARCGLVDGKQGTFPPEPMRFLGAHVVRRRSCARSAPRRRVASLRGSSAPWPASHRRASFPRRARSEDWALSISPHPVCREMRTHDDTRSESMQEFEVRYEGELPATPAAVWDAIAVHAGGWLWPIAYEPRVGGAERGLTSGGGTVTAWDPPRRLATRAERREDGWWNALDYQLEPCRAGTRVHYAHTGVFTGDDHALQDDACRAHTAFYYHSLGQYVEHFAGREATYVSADGPAGSARPGAFAALRDVLGVGDGRRRRRRGAPGAGRDGADRRRDRLPHGRVPRRAHGRRALPLLRARRLGLAGGHRAPPLLAGGGSRCTPGRPGGSGWMR